MHLVESIRARVKAAGGGIELSIPPRKPIRDLLKLLQSLNRGERRRNPQHRRL